MLKKLIFVGLFLIAAFVFSSSALATDYTSPNFSLRDPIVGGTTVQNEPPPDTGKTTNSPLVAGTTQNQTSIIPIVLSLVGAVVAGIFYFRLTRKNRKLRQ